MGAISLSQKGTVCVTYPEQELTFFITWRKAQLATSNPDGKLQPSQCLYGNSPDHAKNFFDLLPSTEFAELARYPNGFVMAVDCSAACGLELYGQRGTGDAAVDYPFLVNVRVGGRNALEQGDGWFRVTKQTLLDGFTANDGAARQFVPAALRGWEVRIRPMRHAFWACIQSASAPKEVLAKWRKAIEPQRRSLLAPDYASLQQDACPQLAAPPSFVSIVGGGRVAQELLLPDYNFICDRALHWMPERDDIWQPPFALYGGLVPDDLLALGVEQETPYLQEPQKGSSLKELIETGSMVPVSTRPTITQAPHPTPQPFPNRPG